MLRVALLLGSTRVSGPPKPVNLGKRVGLFVAAAARARGTMEVEIFDPLEYELPLLQRPQFSYAAGRAPSVLDELAGKFQAADAYIMVTPEYNHAPSPALLNTLNHFGSSIFSFKPSAIVSYSAGQWGGTRAAHSLRPALSELGCLPVSAMIHVPRAGEALAEDGTATAEPERWASYAGRALAQLEWWGAAARARRAEVDPLAASPAFEGSPAQRNAP